EAEERALAPWPADELDAEWKSPGTRARGQVDGRETEHRHHTVEHRIPRARESLRRLARSARREEDVDLSDQRVRGAPCARNPLARRQDVARRGSSALFQQ